MSEPEASRPWWVLPSGRIHPGWWMAIAPGLIWLEYALGPEAQLPALYVLPVCVAAWYSGARTALALAISVPLARLTFVLMLWGTQAQPGLVIGTEVVRATIVAFIGLVFARQSEHERNRRRDMEQRHALQIRAEQLRVVQVTMRTVQDIVNNCLNQLLLLRIDAEGHVPAESLEMYDQAIKDASAQLKKLADLDEYAEKQMEMGPALDVGEARSLRP